MRQWGAGPRTAVLIHGYTDDAETWWHVGPALATSGWRVLAPDLRGHGSSPRADSYSLPLLAEDLVDTVPAGVDLLVGHSLGAVVVNLAAPALRPERTVLVDPPWGPLPTDLAPPSPPVTAQGLAVAHPSWSAQDVRVDLASSGRMDPRVTSWLCSDPFAELTGPLPLAPFGPTALVLPATAALVPCELLPDLRARGFDILVIPGVGHVVHRDDPAAWLAAVTAAELVA